MILFGKRQISSPGLISEPRAGMQEQFFANLKTMISFSATPFSLQELISELRAGTQEQLLLV